MLRLYQRDFYTRDVYLKLLYTFFRSSQFERRIEELIECQGEIYLSGNRHALRKERAYVYCVSLTLHLVTMRLDLF